MKVIALAVLAATLAAGPLGAAQLYRWVDEKGNVEYRDTPPPPHAKKVERRDMSGNTIETSTLPYNVQLAVKNYPVTLWSYDCGDPCAKGRAHLVRRGVPFTERNPQKEQEAMKKATGGTEVPFLFVGSTPLKGYLDSAWDNALDNAGYPRTPPPGTKPQPASAVEGPAAKPQNAKAASTPPSAPTKPVAPAAPR